MKVNWFYFFVFFILFALVGYGREYFFLSYNHLLYIKYFKHGELHPDAILLYFYNKDYTTLYYLKYLFTIVSIGFFLLLSILAVRFIFNSKKIIKWTVNSYLILLTLAGLSMLYGYFVKNRLQDDEYTLSRWLVGIAQSPLIIIILVASYKLIETNDKSSES